MRRYIEWVDVKNNIVLKEEIPYLFPNDDLMRHIENMLHIHAWSCKVTFEKISE